MSICLTVYIYSHFVLCGFDDFLWFATRIQARKSTIVVDGLMSFVIYNHIPSERMMSAYLNETAKLWVDAAAFDDVDREPAKTAKPQTVASSMPASPAFKTL